jgi:hypothetical protein
MIRIKFDNQFPEWNWIRQTPNSCGIWKDAQFFINDETISDCDFYFVQGGLKEAKKVNCSNDNIFFIALENKDIHKYNEDFLKQFHTIITHRDDVKHNIVKNSIVPAFWFVGSRQLKNGNTEWSKGYDELSAINTSKTKTKLVSVISSNKTNTEGHRLRLNFVNVLKEHFGHEIDVFGRGINDIEDKWDALANYKYHIVLENSSYEDEVTEKMYDAYLAQVFPIYYGAPNAKKYFSEHSFLAIDITKPEESIQKIKQCIADDTYSKSIDEINKSKGKVLNQYNLFEIMHKFIEVNKANEPKTKLALTILPEEFFIHTELSKQTFIKRVVDKIKKISQR